MLKLPDVITQTALSRSSIYAAIKQGRFPAPVKIGRRSVAWLREDIERWKATRPRSLIAPAVARL